ncbi:MAG: methyltransferase domain-containing protein [Alphaproteobacteria bacterium]|nr:methyltransferase domain-containing protein [Alphaproteobacteria bacterium]
MAAVVLEGRPLKIPFRVRLAAWWEGYDPADIYPGDPAPLEFDTARSEEDTAAEAKSQPTTKVPLWSAERIDVVERLWGFGMHNPGGDDHIQTLVRPFSLNPTMNVLDIGAGLGGATRTMCKTFGCWVTGLEQWPILVDAGMQRSIAAGIEKKAPVEAYDPATIELKQHGYNCVFAKEAFFTIADKVRLIGAISESLRPGGQLCFTDYVLPEDAKPTPAVDAWAKKEPLEPFLCSSQDTLELLTHNGLEVRVAEDMTDTHQALILQGWRDLTQSLKPGSIPPAAVPHLVAEAELWARRGAVLRTGDIRVYRFHALKSAEPISA